MTTGTELELVLPEWESLVLNRFPEARPADSRGLDDDEIEQLRDALLPCGLPEQVEVLYRWRNGTATGVFAGWRLRPLDELLSWREFCLAELREPPAWLQLFDDQCLGFVTLPVPGGEADDGVWFGHTHDADVERLCRSIAAMVRSCLDAAEADDLHLEWDRLITRADHNLDSPGFDAYRLPRNPGCFAWPDPPEGTYVSRFPEPSWPRPWLRSIGVDDDALTLRGATATIRELLEHATAARTPTVETIRARVTALAGSIDGSRVTVDDGTGVLDVWCPAATCRFLPRVGGEFELDVVVRPGPPLLGEASAVRPVDGRSEGPDQGCLAR